MAFVLGAAIGFVVLVYAVIGVIALVDRGAAGAVARAFLGGSIVLWLVSGAVLSQIRERQVTARLKVEDPALLAEIEEHERVLSRRTLGMAAPQRAVTERVLLRQRNSMWDAIGIFLRQVRGRWDGYLNR